MTNETVSFEKVINGTRFVVSLAPSEKAKLSLEQLIKEKIIKETDSMEAGNDA